MDILNSVILEQLNPVGNYNTNYFQNSFFKKAEYNIIRHT